LALTLDAAPSRVLIVEDDDSIAEAVAIVVNRMNCVAVRAANGKEGLRVFFDDDIALVILDVGLPGMDGWQVLERIRDLSEVPILMLTARDLEQDKVRGLTGGADDYLTKPFGIRELGARVEALLRRSRLATASRGDTEPDVFIDDNLEVDFTARTVRVHGVEVALTPLEFRLLGAFVAHAGQALSNEQLLQLAWDDPYGISPDRVKFTVLRLRRKLGWQQADLSPLESVRGYGYRYRRVQ
jgi:DNA-binding response OmpR family regulator